VAHEIGRQLRSQERSYGAGAGAVGAGEAGPRLGLGVVVGVGVHVVGQHPPVGRADELDAGHLGAVAGEEGLQPRPQLGLDALLQHQVKGAGAVHHAPAVTDELGQHAGGQLGGERCPRVCTEVLMRL